MIQGFLQTDPRLLPVVQKYGCALLDCCYLSAVDFQPSDVNEMFMELRQVGEVDDECTINSWMNVLESVSVHLQFKTIAPIDYVCLASEREILKWYLSNVEEDHFTVGNGAGMTKWDSMNRPDIMRAYATFVSKVVVTYLA